MRKPTYLEFFENCLHNVAFYAFFSCYLELAISSLEGPLEDEFLAVSPPNAEESLDHDSIQPGNEHV